MCTPPGSNRVLAECNATTLEHAVEQLSPLCLAATLDKTGYAKVSDTTYTVAEYYNNGVGA